MTEEKKKEQEPEDRRQETAVSNSLIKEALKAYGIDAKFVLKTRMEGNTVVIVTNGGAKVLYKAGDKVEPLDPVRVDGIIRKKMKPITGAKK